MDEPYLDGNLGKADQDCDEFKGHLLNWSKSNVKCVIEMPELIEKIEKIFDEANSASETIEEDAKQLQGMDVLKAPVNLAFNCKLLGEGLNKMRKLLPMGKEG